MAIHALPIAFDCGSLMAHLEAVAYSDQPPEALPPRVAKKDTDLLSIPSHHEEVDENYHWSGDGSARVDMEGHCSSAARAGQPARLTLGADTTLFGHSGHAGGGFGQGGAATGNPEWTGRIHIKPHAIFPTHWRVVISYSIASDIPKRECDLGVNGEFVHPTLNAPDKHPWSVHPGDNSILLKCSAPRWEVRPGIPDHDDWKHEKIKVKVMVQKIR